MTNKQHLLLCDTKAGDVVKLIKTNAGARLNSRLAAMGILPGAEFTVINNGHPGPIVVKVKDCKMVLGRGMAHKTLIERVK